VENLVQRIKTSILLQVQRLAKYPNLLKQRSTFTLRTSVQLQRREENTLHWGIFIYQTKTIVFRNLSRNT